MTPILFLDGGLGTTLEDKYNITLSKPLWSANTLLTQKGRDSLLQCQSDFGRIPVDVIETATYQYTLEGFEIVGVGGSTKVQKCLENAIDIAAEAAGQQKTARQDSQQSADGGVHPSTASQPLAGVAFSLGPYGVAMNPTQEYTGDYDSEHDDVKSLAQWHSKRLDPFMTLPSSTVAKVGYLAFETVPRRDEIIAIRDTLGGSGQVADDSKSTTHSHVSGIPFWISCVYPGNGDDLTLPDGSSPEEAVEALLDDSLARATPWGIGINCTKIYKLRHLVEIYAAQISRMVQAGRLETWPALVLYPDGTNGEVYNTTTQTWELPADGVGTIELAWEEQLADIVIEAARRDQWRTILVGGCCKTTSGDIVALRRAVGARNPE